VYAIVAVGAPFHRPAARPRGGRGIVLLRTAPGCTGRRRRRDGRGVAGRDAVGTRPRARSCDPRPLC